MIYTIGICIYLLIGFIFALMYQLKIDRLISQSKEELYQENTNFAEYYDYDSEWFDKFIGVFVNIMILFTWPWFLLKQSKKKI